jgi:prolyl-tRNA synthetase
MAKAQKKALPVTRSENFSEWYQAVIDAAEMAEASGVRGCMIIKPWGYKIWERIQKRLDAEIQRTGHDNCYFPIFIPLELIEKEASHVEGFAKEMAVVTHHRLEVRDGKLVPAAPLESPLVVRPTSEAMITPAFKRWVQSYRDLPIKINQWANVVRWEMRPRLFLRTSEFLWQEGHTVHASAAEAQEETQTMLRIYADLAEKFMAIPVIPGTKSAGERFPGAVETHTIEAMMQDGRALQAGTSHYLGQNFASAADLTYLDQQGEWQTPHTTSWGASTRLIGALIMVHSDDDGLRLPPTLAPHQVVIVPIIREGDDETKILDVCGQLAARLGEQTYEGEPIRIHIDRRPDTPSNKRWAWVKKGAPLVLEIGIRDIEGGQVSVHNRLAVGDRAVSRPTDEFIGTIGQTLKGIQLSIYEEARAYRKAMIRTDVSTFEEFKAHFKEQSGFVRAKWSGNPESEAELKEASVTIRCLPYEQTGTQGVCVLTGAPATTDAIFAKAY